MKKLILILIALPCLAFEYPLSIGGHTLNFYNGSPSEIVDKSGSGNDGTVYGTTLANDGSDNVVGSFDGVDDYIVSANTISTPVNSNITLMAWVYKTDVSQVNYIAPIISYGAVSAVNCFGFRNEKLWFWKEGAAAGSTTIDLLTWYHIAYTYDGTTHKVYLNGVLNGSATGTITPQTDNFEISGNFGNYAYSTRYFKGNIDNASIYSRALSPTEITALYNAKRTASKDVISTNGLVAFYDFQPPDKALATIEPTWYFSDLLAWYPFSTNNANDYSDNSNDGTVNGATYDGLNNGYLFDGVDDYIDCGDVTDLNGLTNLTFSLWFKTSASAYNAYITKYTDNNHCLLLYITSNDDLRFVINNGAWVDFMIADFGLDYDDNNWYMMTATYDGKYKRIYVDGVLIATSGANEITFPNNSADLVIGKGHSTSYDFDGNIDDPRIYNRALAASEILTIFNGTKGTH